MNQDTLLTIILAFFFLWLYYLPTIVACKQRHHNKRAIFLLNTALGWTIFGWILAAVWAVTKPAPANKGHVV